MKMISIRSSALLAVERVLALIMAILILSLVGCGPNDIPDHSGTTDATELTIAQTLTAGDLLDGYTVVVDKSGEFTDIGYLLSQELSELYGAELGFSREAAFAGGPAILIGNTSVAENIKDQLKSDRDYIIKRENDDFVIVGGDVDAVFRAVERFKELLSSDLGLSELHTRDFALIYNESFIIIDESIIIIIPSSDWSRVADTLAYKLSKLIGTRPNILNENDYTANLATIWLGPTTKADVSLRSKDRSISVSGDDIVLSVTDIDSASSLIDSFIGVIEHYDGRLPSSLQSIYPYDYAEGEYEAELINNLPTSVTDLSTTPITVYEPSGERYYNHDAYLALFQGKLYAGWSSGYYDENAPGQRIVFSVSQDGGNSWSAPTPIADTKRGDHSELVYNFRGFYNNGESMIAYFSAFEYDANVLRDGERRPETDVGRGAYTMYYSITRDGVQWSDPIELIGLPVFRSTYGGPASKSSLLFPGHSSFVHSNSLDGTSGFTVSSTDSQSAVKRGAEVLWEASYYSTQDGTLFMLMRSNKNQLWCCISRDNGNSWSEAYPTAFSDGDAKVQFSNLPDGRAYYVGCPEPNESRKPLILAISENGMDFNKQYVLGANESYRQQKTGIYKNGSYSYPSAICDGENIYVIYSAYKEAVRFMRISLDELS